MFRRPEHAGERTRVGRMAGHRERVVAEREPAVAVLGPHQLGRERGEQRSLRAVVLFVGEQRERRLERFDSFVVGLPGAREEAAVEREHRFRGAGGVAEISRATRYARNRLVRDSLSPAHTWAWPSARSSS